MPAMWCIFSSQFNAMQQPRHHTSANAKSYRRKGRPLQRHPHCPHEVKVPQVPGNSHHALGEQHHRSGGRTVSEAGGRRKSITAFRRGRHWSSFPGVCSDAACFEHATLWGKCSGAGHGNLMAQPSWLSVFLRWCCIPLGSPLV